MLVSNYKARFDPSVKRSRASCLAQSCRHAACPTIANHESNQIRIVNSVCQILTITAAMPVLRHAPTTRGCARFFSSRFVVNPQSGIKSSSAARIANRESNNSGI